MVERGDQRQGTQGPLLSVSDMPDALAELVSWSMGWGGEGQRSEMEREMQSRRHGGGANPQE